MLTKSVLWINQGSLPARGNLPANFRWVHMDPVEALRELERTGFDAVVLDFPVTGWTPEELLGHVQRLASRAASSFATQPGPHGMLCSWPGWGHIQRPEPARI